jgi:hypothetical protein
MQRSVDDRRRVVREKVLQRSRRCRAVLCCGLISGQMRPMIEDREGAAGIARPAG